MRCVIADDSPIMRGEIRGQLLNGGHDVIAVCTNGKEAVATCERLRPDLVILDVVMPPMNGNEAALHILDGGTAKRVLLATGNPQDSVIKPALDRGAKYLAKPFHGPKLLAKIAEFDGDAD